MTTGKTLGYEKVKSVKNEKTFKKGFNSAMKKGDDSFKCSRRFIKS